MLPAAARAECHKAFGPGVRGGVAQNRRMDRPRVQLPAAPLRALRAVAAVADTGSAAGAAAALHLSASGVPRAVQPAEAAAGLALFERVARGMVCTRAGEVLAARVRRAQAELRQGPAPALAARASDTMLAAFLAVAAQRSEAAAAAQLGCSQPAVHAALRQLEHAARLRLLERSRRGTRLTEAGEALRPRVHRALAELRVAADELAALRGETAGRVALGALPMAADVLVPQALARLYERLPALQVTVVDGTYEALLTQLRHGEVDVVVGPLRGTAAPPDVVEQRLFVDRLRPVARAGHPLLARGRRLRRADLARRPWIGPLPGTPARAAFERAFAGGTLPTVVLQVNAPAVVRSMLLAGDALALVSPLQIQAELRSGLLALLPLKLPGTEREIGLMLRRDGAPSGACDALLDALRAVAPRS